MEAYNLYNQGVKKAYEMRVPLRSTSVQCTGINQWQRQYYTHTHTPAVMKCAQCVTRKPQCKELGLN